MMIACHQAHDSKPRLLLLSRELCHAHHHPANIMGLALLRKAYPVVLQQGGRWPVAVRVPRRQFSPLAWYNKQLEKSPVITKSITSGGSQRRKWAGLVTSTYMYTSFSSIWLG